MPFRAEAPFLLFGNHDQTCRVKKRINALSGWGSISTYSFCWCYFFWDRSVVSMPSRAEAPFLQKENNTKTRWSETYQCPLGLELHFYNAFRTVTQWWIRICINALSGWGYISTETGWRQKLRSKKKVSMPFRAETTFLPEGKADWK